MGSIGTTAKSITEFQNDPDLILFRKLFQNGMINVSRKILGYLSVTNMEKVDLIKGIQKQLFHACFNPYIGSPDFDCGICLETSNNECTFTPCGHSGICMPCAKKYIAYDVRKVCMYCQRPYDHIK